MSGRARVRTRTALRSGYSLEWLRGDDTREATVSLEQRALVLVGGSAVVRIGSATHELAAPMIALANPGVAFAIVETCGAERLFATLRPVMIAEIVTKLGLDGAGVVLFKRPVAPTSEAIELSARRVIHEITSAARGDDRLLDLTVEVFAADVLRDHGHVHGDSRLELSRAGIVDRRLRRSVEFMHDNFARDLPLGDIADAAYLSEYHFARLFKRITGVTPNAYLASIRIEQARRLLAETDLPIAVVGERVGYHSASHFGKVFRQIAGVTPTVFRDDACR